MLVAEESDLIIKCKIQLGAPDGALKSSVQELVLRRLHNDELSELGQKSPFYAGRKHFRTASKSGLFLLTSNTVEMWSCPLLVDT